MSVTEIDETDPAYALEAKEIALNRNIDETISLRDSPVQLFFKDAVVLVTGASGFLGKQLIEKLFRSCEIKKIYIVLRNKALKSFKARVEDMTKDMLYDNLRKTHPDFLDKLIPVAGDISLLRLGLDDETWNRLTEEVNVIFHVAATVNFVEPLKKAVLTNVRGTREMIKLAQHCKNLKSFVHVSTAFSHAVPERANQPVLEQFYQTPISPELLIEMVETIDEQKIDGITPILLGSRPNTYAYTKAAAEEVVRTMAGDLPICIVRPAIVMPSYREPPGWVDRSTMNGPVGFIAGACLGGLHVMFANTDNTVDMVPVDVVNNACVVAARAASARDRGAGEVNIYTVTNNRNSLSIGELRKYLISDEIRNLNTPLVLWYGFVVLTTNKLVFLLLSWLLHYVPGYLVDGVLKLAGKKPKAIRLFDRAYVHNKIYGYFMTHSWKFDDKNLYNLYKNLTPKDQIIYNFDMTSVDVFKYVAICCIGTRKYIFRDGLQNTRYAVKKGKIFRVLNYICMFALAYMLWKFVVLLFSVLQTVF